MKKTVAILTPTYNRAHIIGNLYKSLYSQTNYDFKWYVIDDGSTDNTEELINAIVENRFEIFYVKKENGGKHTAINHAMKYIDEELTFIVDSDDYLSDDAIETIIKDWDMYKAHENICGLSYYKAYTNNEVVGMHYPDNEYKIATFIDYRINKKITGDKAEVYRTSVLKAFPFPEFKGEKFLSESTVWKAISNAGHMLVFVPKAIYYCEYLDGGLTSLGRKKQLSCPLGTIEHAKAYLYPSVNFITKVKYMCMLIATAKYADIGVINTIKQTKNNLLSAISFIPGIALGTLWRKKYKL